MPIGSEGSETRKIFDDVYHYVIVPGVSLAKRSYKCIRADEVQKPNNIIKDIAQKLYNADVVIADLTGQNPNVFYELGVRHALVGKTIILSQSFTDIPFDLRGYRTIIYSPGDLSGNEQTKKQIAKFLQEIDEKSSASDNPVSETFGGFPQSKVDQKPQTQGDILSYEIQQLRRVFDQTAYSLLQQTEYLSPNELKKTIQQALDEKLTSFRSEFTRNEDISILEDLRKAGIANAYNRRDVAMKRILELLPTARESIWLMGISLRKFFHRSSELRDRIRALQGHPLEWRALVIDPETDQALFRSLREQETTYKKMLREGQLNYSHLAKDELFNRFTPIYTQMQLYTDVMQTKSNVKVAIEELGLRISLRFYRAAPVAFLAIIDDFLFVEQYHYGAITDDRVAEQVPVLEFRRGSDMFRQLQGHFEYVWNSLSRDPFEENHNGFVQQRD
jgi:hypothetical protein